MPNEKYKTLLVNNKEDNFTEVIITNNRNDVSKPPRRLFHQSHRYFFTN